MSQNKYKLNLNLVTLKSDPHLNEAKIADLKNNFNKSLLPLIENHREKKYTTNSSYFTNPTIIEHKSGKVL